MNDESRIRGAGGTPGGIGEFFLGLLMVVIGAYLITNRILVVSSYWSLGGYSMFGLSLLPLIFGIGILFFNGKSILGWILLERLPSPIQQKIRGTLQTGRLDQSPALAQLAGAWSTLRGESGNGLPFRLVGPLGQVVRTEQPTFRWHALAGAQSYTVAVTDAELNEVATSPPLNATEWQIPKPLKQGGIYSWQVTALKDGVKITSPVLPAPQAKFKVIDRTTSEMLQQTQRAYPDSHLTLGVLYAEAGLLDEAEQELRVLVRDNPRASVAQKLLRQVQSMKA